MVRFVPEAYGRDARLLTRELALSDRVHYFDFVPYEQLTRVMSGGDVGVIVRDPGVANNFLLLPNRVFDMLSAGLPIVSPEIPDIARITGRFEAGTALAKRGVTVKLFSFTQDKTVVFRHPGVVAHFSRS